MEDHLDTDGLPAEELEEFLAGQLGPACLERFGELALRKELAALLTDGVALEDAVLRLVHRESAFDRVVADEFLGHFLSAMTRIGHFLVSDGLRRYLDSGDLVDSIVGNLWQEFTQVEFRTRREFLAFLGRRMQWKAADKARGLAAGRRREDLHREVDFATAGLSNDDQPGPSTLAMGAEDRDRLILALLRLPPRDREILNRHLRGEDHAEVARALGLQPAAARKALQRAIEKARALF